MAKDMWVGVFETTQKQWLLVQGNNSYPSSYEGGNWHYTKNNKYPIEDVSWSVIDSFLGKLKQRTVLSSVRRPTLLEWQYACRAGTKTDLNNGKSLTTANANLVAYWGIRVSGANAYNAWANGAGHPVVVGSYAPNNWGLYDMHGNVSEATTHSTWIAGGAGTWYSGGSYNSELSGIKVTAEAVGDSRAPTGGGFRVFADAE